ncbi:MAG: ABC transporter ATP-binding protein [Propionibacterium sp.]|nr:ABC transporter ATP-binding protein [Propionibacterium sp.]
MPSPRRQATTSSSRVPKRTRWLPTTYLDVAHQVEVLRLTRSLQRDGYTVVVVLHDLHLAFRYATQLLVMKDGRIIAQGDPCEIVTAQLNRGRLRAALPGAGRPRNGPPAGDPGG